MSVKMNRKLSTQGANIYRDPSAEIWRYNPRRRRNRALAEKVYKERKYLDFPLHVIIEPTNHCNMICQMCLRNVMTRPKGYMDWDVFRKIVDECSAHNTYSFSLYMLGEPLLHPRIRGMINYSKRMVIPYVDVSTNGLVDMRVLLGTALDELIISLDGIDNVTYNKNRQGDYDKIEQNIIEFLDAKKKGDYEYPFVRLQIIEMETNEPYIEEFIKKWTDKVDVVYLKKLEGMVQGLGNALVTKEEAARKNKERSPCKQLFYTHNIYWNGDHAFCCHDPYGKSVLGNIKDMTIKEAWSAALKKEEIERQKKGIYEGLCEKCIDFENW
jgi:MoaA/NifB/PqqE/SkfB family radical SAM enzyme